MTRLAKVSLGSLLSLSLVSHAAAVQQKTVQASLRATADRTPAPAFSLADASGSMRHLSDYRGKPVVVNLWATNCGGCKIELPSFVKMSGSYQDRVTVLGVSMDIMYDGLKSAAEGWAHVTPFVASHGLTYPILLDDGSVEKAFNVTALPATYLIDRTGRLAGSYIGVVDPDDLDANIKKLLAER
jgi:peroxiredoxin